MAPVLSVVVAVYNVEKYVSATLKSFDQQSVDQELIEYVFVDDGSSDNSGEIVQKWVSRHSNARLIVQENAGAGAARKAALEVISGSWVTVVDPDDILDSEYFTSILDFIDRDIDSVADMLVTKVLVLNDATGRAFDTHPLRYRFNKGSRLVSLIEEPTCIQLGATAVLRTDRLRKHSLTYDTRIEPTFEDAHLLGRYLATTDDPIVGIVSGAKYYYRKRFDQSSLVQTSWSDKSRYSTVLELGYLDMLNSVKRELGVVPEWAQNVVLYDLVWYFKEETQQHSKTAWISGELRDGFLELLMSIFDQIDVETIEKFSVNPMWWSMRQVMLGFFKRTYATGNRVVQWGADRKDGSNQYCVLSFGAEPDVEVFVDGVKIEPTSDNYTVHSFFGVPMMVERNFRVGLPGQVNVFVDGQQGVIERAVTKVDAPKQNSSRGGLAPKLEEYSRTDRALHFIGERNLSSRSTLDKLQQFSKKASYINSKLHLEKLALSDTSGRVLARTASRVLTKATNKTREQRALSKAASMVAQAKSVSVRSKYRDAWVILDRPLRADDNGEHFYRYLKGNRPEINSYFLLDRKSPDWERLEHEGFRLVEYGSDESILLLLNAKFRMSSDAIAEVMYPINRKLYNLSGSKFIFLQHGVTKDDLSRWINPKRLDGMVCATVGEHSSIVGRNSPYTLKSNQALLTGFPRFDRLHELVEERKSPADLLLFMPTWRQYLRDELEASSDPTAKSSIFNLSEFGQNWLELLNSQELKELAARYNKKVGFIAHPAFADLIAFLDIPNHVEILDPSVLGFQNLLVRAAVFVTDYSSVAFDAANIGTPVVYFQFDPETMFGGGHNFRRGYFDYERDGFGPVCPAAIDAVTAIGKSLDSNADSEMRIYQRRVAEAFPHADTKNSERLADAILRL